MTLTFTIAAGQCASGKVKYDTAEEAIAAARGIERAGRRGQTGNTPYRCEWCDSFHIGRSNPERHRRRLR